MKFLARFLAPFRHRSKESLAAELADRAERLLVGSAHGWDVDNYEHFNPREPDVRELWNRTMEIGGLPEEWPGLDENRKQELRNIIVALKALAAPKTT